MQNTLIIALTVEKRRMEMRMAEYADYIERLDALKELALLDTGEEEYTDNISRTRAAIAIANILAANVFRVACSLDEHRERGD